MPSSRRPHGTASAHRGLARSGGRWRSRRRRAQGDGHGFRLARRARRLHRRQLRRRAVGGVVPARGLVREPREAVLASSRLAVRAGMERALHHERGGGLACLARRWRDLAAGRLWRQPDAEFRVVGDLLRAAPDGLGVLLADRVVAVDRRNDAGLRAPFAHGAVAARALSRLGHVRGRAQPRDVAPERLRRAAGAPVRRVRPAGGTGRSLRSRAAWRVRSSRQKGVCFSYRAQLVANLLQ